jgi:hypothetical protein
MAPLPVLVVVVAQAVSVIAKHRNRVVRVAGAVRLCLRNEQCLLLTTALLLVVAVVAVVVALRITAVKKMMLRVVLVVAVVPVQ